MGNLGIAKRLSAREHIDLELQAEDENTYDRGDPKLDALVRTFKQGLGMEGRIKHAKRDVMKMSSSVGYSTVERIAGELNGDRPDDYNIIFRDIDGSTYFVSNPVILHLIENHSDSDMIHALADDTAIVTESYFGGRLRIPRIIPEDERVLFSIDEVTLSFAELIPQNGHTVAGHAIAQPYRPMMTRDEDGIERDTIPVPEMLLRHRPSSELYDPRISKN